MNTLKCELLQTLGSVPGSTEQAQIKIGFEVILLIPEGRLQDGLTLLADGRFKLRLAWRLIKSALGCCLLRIWGKLKRFLGCSH